MQVSGNWSNVNTNWNQKSKAQKSNQSNINNPLNEHNRNFGTINLGWSDGATYAYGTPNGNSFSIYKGEGYSSNEPWMYVNGIDEKGNEYEEKINAKEVNPNDASFVEIMALNSYLVDEGTLKTESLGFFPRENADDLTKQDYMSILQEWRNMQQSMGNLAGYKNFSDVCNAFKAFYK